MAGRTAGSLGWRSPAGLLAILWDSSHAKSGPSTIPLLALGAAAAPATPNPGESFSVVAGSPSGVLRGRAVPPLGKVWLLVSPLVGAAPSSDFFGSVSIVSVHFF